MQRPLLLTLLIIILLAVTAIAIVHSRTPPAPAVPVAEFHDWFNEPFELEETNSAASSTSPVWRLSSGGLFVAQDGIGQTIHGELPDTSPWHRAYAKSNPTDTDNGTHPQNIFRLETQKNWQNYTQEGYFRIDANNLSESPNRNASNGLFFFNRAKDSNNLYYTGLRVDGAAVIKKKIDGKYHTMAEIPIFPGEYNATTTPTLLPQHTWIGLRSVVSTAPSGTVTIQLFISSAASGTWALAAETTDDNTRFGGPAFTNPGYAGIRTDFMDVSFEGYSIYDLSTGQ